MNIPACVPVFLCLVGCSDLTGTPGLPAGTPNPAIYNTATGALGMRNAAIFEVETAIPQYITDAGLITDELEDAETGASPGLLLESAGVVSDPLDERILPALLSNGSSGANDGAISYGDLQNIRAYAAQALGALATYDTTTAERDTADVLRGELYAMEGYAEIALADLFCSGVPLSSLVYQGNFIYLPGSNTTQVYQDAIAKFDTALTLASASDSVENLARILKGRTYLDLGQYTAAADDVTEVPTQFVYQLVVPWFPSASLGSPNSTTYTVSDREGQNGLPFRSSDDPRTGAIGFAINQETGDSLYFPAKYSAALSGSGYAPVTLASGVEARLMQAEDALQQGDATTWLSDLNALRATVSGLSQIVDPVDPAARVDTTFTERAAWLFVDGHREGDLRRLLRQYSQYTSFRSQSQVYPVGSYLAPGTGQYGADVNAPIPPSEFANPFFTGCLSREP